MKKYLFLIFLSLPLVSGCSSLMDKTGRILDGSAFTEKELSVYRETRKSGLLVKRVKNRAGEEYITISTDKMPNLTLKAVPFGDKGDFTLTSLHYLCSSLFGWNEIHQEITGTGKLLITEHDAIFMLNGAPAALPGDAPDSAPAIGDEAVPDGPPAIVTEAATADPPDDYWLETGPMALDIQEGRIRHKNTRLVKNQALSALRNRQERIIVMAAWMNEQPDLPVFANQKEFEKYWKPIVLPELVPMKKRPPAWSRENAAWERGEDIRWNVVYTERVFPEALWKVRNSGTMLRDWEEASGWIYMEYEWNRLMEALATERPLIKIK